MSMKIVKFLFVLSLIAISACVSAPKKVSVEQALVPGWKLGYENLDVLSTAFDQKDEPGEYAVHSVDDPMLTANIIVKSWQFSWKDDEYEILESDSFIKAQHRAGPMFYYKVLNYTIYSLEDDEFVMELEKVESPDGEVQFLVRPEGDGIIVNIFDLGEITRRTYSELPAQYGYSNSKLKSLAHSEEFSYCAFDSDTLDIVLFENKAMRENDILKILSRQEHSGGTEMRLNQEAEVIYMSSDGLKFVQCDVDIALEERSKHF
jgi:hypothetical protein